MRMAFGLAALALWLSLASGCARMGTGPATDTRVPPLAEDAGPLPFDRQAQPGGISPTNAVIPPPAHVPAGTPVTIRLQTALSSASAHAGDIFVAVLDEPIIVDGQTLAERGARVTGRIIDAKASANLGDPGYLRLALATISVYGKLVAVQTSSIFAKNAVHQKPRVALIGAGKAEFSNSPIHPATAATAQPGASSKDISFGPDHRLTFRLTEPIPIRG